MNQPPQSAARAVSLLLAVAPISGCATNPATPARTTRPDVAHLLVDIPLDPATIRSVPIFTPAGQSVPWTELVAQAAAADVVLIGETHGHPRGLPAAAALFEDLVAKRSAADTPPVLAMEFFERDQQAALDDFLAGLTDEPAMLRATSKSSPESYPPGHRAMILLAKRQGLPVIAANAPRRYVRLARTDGYDRLRRLTPEQRRLFDLPISEPSAAYREAFDRVMN
ncbi:MAG: ChaN family lipoprotein, partial [Phycisphaerales bacterium]|nr:ChaN family lipoprotein [Phycisphaerales bacterium]